MLGTMQAVEALGDSAWVFKNPRKIWSVQGSDLGFERYNGSFKHDRIDILALDSRRSWHHNILKVVVIDFTLKMKKQKMHKQKKAKDKTFEESDF